MSNSGNQEKNRTSASDNGVVFYDAPRPAPKENTTADTAASGGGSAKVLRICAIVLGVIMILTGTGCLLVFGFYSRINYQAIDVEDEVVSRSSSVNSETNTYSGPLLTDAEILNILLIGADTRYNQDRGNSDTMIMMSVDTRHKKLKLLSFMRDTYVSIPGYSENKLTAAYNLGGAALTVRTIQANYGIRIDRYAIVDFKSFRNIIDTLGGLDVELTQEEVDYIDWQCWKNNQVETRHELNAESYTYTGGEDGEGTAMVHLNGRQALWHARNRGEEGICSGDDYTRTQRQRNVIGLLVNKLKSSDAATIMSVLYDIGPMITTNLKSSEISSLAGNIVKYLNYEIVSASAPQYDMIGIDFYYSDYNRPIYVDGWMVSCIVICDWEEFRVKTAEFVFGDGSMGRTETTE